MLCIPILEWKSIKVLMLLLKLLVLMLFRSIEISRPFGAMLLCAFLLECTLSFPWSVFWPYGPTRWQDLWLSVLIGWIVWTNFLEIPMPNIIEKAPDNIRIAINQQLNWPEVPGTELGKLFKIFHHFYEVCLNLRYVSFWWIAIDSFYDLISSIKTVYEIGKDDTCPTIRWKNPEQIITLFVAHRLE